jgi:hypothetical protein
LKRKHERELEAEKESLRRAHAQTLQNMQREFESEKQSRKEKFGMQLSKYMMSGKSIDELEDENEEKREIAVFTMI